MEPRRFKASELVEAIRSGTSYSAMMLSYSLTETQLETVFGRLIERGVVKPEDLPKREHASSKAVSQLPDIVHAQIPLTPPARPQKVTSSAQSNRDESSVPLWLRVKQWVTWPWRALKEKREAERERQLAAMRAKNVRQLALQKRIREAELDLRRLTEALISKGESVVNAPIVLKRGEVAFYTSGVDVLQQKTQKKTFRGYAGTRVKVGKIPIYLGGSAPYTVSQETIVEVGAGSFTITNKRVVLTGAKINYSIKIENINGIERFSDAVQIFDEGSRGGRVYKVDDPVKAAIMLEVLLQRRA